MSVHNDDGGKKISVMKGFMNMVTPPIPNALNDVHDVINLRDNNFNHDAWKQVPYDENIKRGDKVVMDRCGDEGCSANVLDDGRITEEALRDLGLDRDH